MLEKGKIHYDEKGYPRCHICGKSFKKVLTHVWQKHGMNEKEYKKEFELDAGKGIICQETREKLQQSIKSNYDVVVKQNLIKGGKSNRFTEGSAGRTRDKIRLQTKLVLKDNFMGGR